MGHAAWLSAEFTADVHSRAPNPSFAVEHFTIRPNVPLRLIACP
jgi:hypothetical protein